MKLDEFIRQYLNEGLPKNSYVDEPGFSALYVRVCSRRVIDGVELEPVLDIANVKAEHPGSGAFTRLIARLQKEYPGLNLYIECVQNPRLRAHLERLGFEQCGSAHLGFGAPSYYIKKS